MRYTPAWVWPPRHARRVVATTSKTDGEGAMDDRSKTKRAKRRWESEGSAKQCLERPHTWIDLLGVRILPEFRESSPLSPRSSLRDNLTGEACVQHNQCTHLPHHRQKDCVQCKNHLLKLCTSVNKLKKRAEYDHGVLKQQHNHFELARQNREKRKSTRKHL